MNYDPRDWYWIVGGDETLVYASMRAAFVPAAGVPPFHKVSTYRVLRRLEDAGRIDAAEAALNANRVLWRRFYTVGAINADDADSRAFLAAIGADADAILAPE